MAFPTITLTIEDDHHVRARKDDDAEAFGDFRLTDLQYSLLDLFADWLVQKKITERREMELFGSLMYQALINGSVKTLIEQALGQLAAEDRLRLQLSFRKDAAELAGLPWEFLYRPDTETHSGFFLATGNNLVLSRYIPLQTGVARTLKPDKPPLRILIAVTQAPELPAVVAKPVIEAVQKLHREFPIGVQRVEKPTRMNILDALLDFQPHVFHFITHGRFDRDRKAGEVALLKPDGESVDWVEDRTFADFFDPLKGTTRLVFLHHCEGGTVDFKANFAGLAPQLIRAGVQATIAMQYPITNAAAVEFSTRFYQALMRGEPVDHAVQTSRWRIRMAVDDKRILLRDFGTPVLYMRSHDGIIRPDAAPAAPGTPSVPGGDPFTLYEIGLRLLLAQLGPDHGRYNEALVYQQRLLENITTSRLYGDTDTRKAERAEIIARLNAIALAELHTPFNTLCGSP